MAKLKAKRRRSLPSSSFAYPQQRRYPIHTAGHRRAALSMAARSDTFGTYAHVKKRINQKLGKTAPAHRGKRTARRRKS